jgi:hypothetical protein
VPGEVERSIVDYVISQGLGVVFGAVCFYLLIKEKRSSEKRLVDVIRERKTDRDDLLQTLGAVKSHLAARDAYDVATGEVLNPAIPKRREIDRLIVNALQTAIAAAAKQLPPASSSPPASTEGET